MLIELINKVTEPISVVSEGIKEGFARCNSEEEIKQNTFNIGDLSNWNTSKLKNTRQMFFVLTFFVFFVSNFVIMNQKNIVF